MPVRFFTVRLDLHEYRVRDLFARMEYDLFAKILSREKPHGRIGHGVIVKMAGSLVNERRQRSEELLPRFRVSGC